MCNDIQIRPRYDPDQHLLPDKYDEMILSVGILFCRQEQGIGLQNMYHMSC